MAIFGVFMWRGPLIKRNWALGELKLLFNSLCAIFVRHSEETVWIKTQACVRGDRETTRRLGQRKAPSMKGKVGLEQWRYPLERGREKEGRLDSINRSLHEHSLGYSTSATSWIFFLQFCFPPKTFLHDLKGGETLAWLTWRRLVLGLFEVLRVGAFVKVSGQILIFVLKALLIRRYGIWKLLVFLYPCCARRLLGLIGDFVDNSLTNVSF